MRRGVSGSFHSVSPSASSSLVTPSDSAISKACSRFSRLLCCDTTSMSIRSGLEITPRGDALVSESLNAY